MLLYNKGYRDREEKVLLHGLKLDKKENKNAERK
jgi:hypothetical protein